MTNEGGANELGYEVSGQPDLRKWRLGVHEPVLAPDEVRVWLVELDAGLKPGDDEETAEPGPELVLLAADEQARAARFIRGSRSSPVRELPCGSAADPGVSAGRAPAVAPVSSGRSG